MDVYSKYNGVNTGRRFSSAMQILPSDVCKLSTHSIYKEMNNDNELKFA